MVNNGITPIQGKVQEARQDPIRVESSNIAAAECDALSGMVKENVEPNKTFDYYENKNLLIPSNGGLQVDIVSQVEEEEVKVAPYALIKVTDIGPVSHRVNFLTDAIPHTPNCDGDGGWAYELVTTFSPHRERVFGVPQLRKDPYDFFILRAGERDVFQLGLGGMLPDYYYHFRVGIQYSYKGEEGIVWDDREHVVALPTDGKAKEWRVDDVGHLYVDESGSPVDEGIFNVSYPAEEMAEDYSAMKELQSGQPKDSIEKRIQFEEAEIRKFQTSFKMPQVGNGDW